MSSTPRAVVIYHYSHSVIRQGYTVLSAGHIIFEAMNAQSGQPKVVSYTGILQEGIWLTIGFAQMLVMEIQVGAKGHDVIIPAELCLIISTYPPWQKQNKKESHTLLRQRSNFLSCISSKRKLPPEDPGPLGSKIHGLQKQSRLDHPQQNHP